MCTHCRDSNIRYREVAVFKQPQRYQRFFAVNGLPHDKEGEHDDARDNHAPYTHRDSGSPQRLGDSTPVVSRTLLNTEDHQEQSNSGENHAQPVEVVLFGGEMRDIPYRQIGADHTDRDIDEEDPRPAGTVHEQAAGDRAHERCDTGRRAPHAHCHPAFMRREHERNNGHGLRGHNRGAYPLHHARNNQHLHIGRKTAPQRREGKDHHTEQVHLLLPEPITQATGNQQRHRIGEQVGAGHPNHGGERGVELMLHMGQRHGDDSGIEQDHKEPDHK